LQIPKVRDPRHTPHNYNRMQLVITGRVIGSMIAGGIIIGMLQELSTAILQMEYKFAASFVVMTLVLLLKPEGIFRDAK